MPTADTNPPITAVIPVYNRSTDLKRLLMSFKIIDYNGNLNIIIVDDASTVDYSLIVNDFRNECPKIGINTIKLKKNSGPAVARNAALAQINNGYVWFLDSDSEIFQSNMLKIALEIFRKNKGIKAIGEEVYIFNGKLFTQQLKWYPNYLFSASFTEFKKSPACHSFSIPASNLISARKVFDEIGCFNPKFSKLEENDLCARIREKGYKLFACKEVAVYHHLSAAGRENCAFSFYLDVKKYAKITHISRIKLIALHKKYILFFLPLIDIIISCVILLRQLFQKNNAKDIISKKGGEEIGLLRYAWYHSLAMVSSYFYAYKTAITGRL